LALIRYIDVVVYYFVGRPVEKVPFLPYSNAIVATFREQ